MVINDGKKINSYLKILGAIVFALSILVLISQVVFDLFNQYTEYVLSAELLLFIPIYAYYIIMLIVSWKVITNIQKYGILKKGVLIGSLMGGGISMVILAKSALEGLYSNSWTNADFQSLFIIEKFIYGYPSIIVGAILGISIAWILNKKAHK